MFGLLDAPTTARFLLTAAHDGARRGTLVRWVQPCAADPPMVTVAFKRGSATSPLVHDSRRFALCRLPESDRLLRAMFASDNGWAEDPFLGMRSICTPGGCPIPASAPGWLECTLAFNLDLEADCGLYVGRVSDGWAPGEG